MSKLEHLEGNLWRRRGRKGLTHWYRRRGSLKTGEMLDVRRSLGAEYDRARAEAKRLDALSLDEVQADKPDQRPETLGAYLGWYEKHLRDDLKYRGWMTPGYNLRPLLAFVGDRTIREIERGDIERFLMWRKQQVRPTTVRSTLRDVKRLFEVAVERGDLEKNPAAKIRVQAGSPLPKDVPEEAEVARLLSVLCVEAPRLYPLVMVLIGTGCRLGEALTLNWADVDMARGSLVLHRTKVQDALRMKLIGALKDALWEVWTAKGMPKAGLVFSYANGKSWSRHGVYSQFKRIACKLGWAWLSLKTFRRLAATHVVEATGNLRMAQMLLGHKSAQTTEMYLGRGEQARQRAVETMAGFLEGVTQKELGARLGTRASQGESTKLKS